MSKIYQRLGLDLPIAFHRELKEAARKRNITMSRYVLRLLVAALRNERLGDKVNE